MTKLFECPMCEAKLTGETTDDVVEKIKEHGRKAHDIEEMTKEELDTRKEMIKDV
jgi:predicted small metal-binding protein